MASLPDLINTKGLSVGEIGVEVVDFVFGRNAIVLDDVGLIFGLGLSIPMPLIGFEFKVPHRVPILDYSYSDAPYLDKTSLINGYIKNTPSFTLQGVRPTTKWNKFILNYALNEALNKILDEYVLNGGTFTILTAWGSLPNCLLEKYSGVSDGRSIGQEYEFQFLKANIQSQAIQDKQSSYLKAITGGF